MKNKGLFLVVLIIGILIIDQCIKFYIKTHFRLGEEVLPLGVQWCRIHFVENEGMAFGWSLDGVWGKLILSVFRLVAVVFLGLYMRSLLREGVSFGFLCCLALVWAGAFGNIIDSAFYGLLFSSSEGSTMPAVLLPNGGGYASLLHGKVVDMFYFPLWSGLLPEWIPNIPWFSRTGGWHYDPILMGGQYTEFFRPVFNFADASISVGVFFIVLLQTRFFPDTDQKNAAETVATDGVENAEMG
jgi:signal peptidase II